MYSSLKVFNFVLSERCQIGQIQAGIVSFWHFGVKIDIQEILCTMMEYCASGKDVFPNMSEPDAQYLHCYQFNQSLKDLLRPGAKASSLKVYPPCITQYVPLDLENFKVYPPRITQYVLLDLETYTRCTPHVLPNTYPYTL